jgi:hypothetical protein
VWGKIERKVEEKKEKKIINVKPEVRHPHTSPKHGGYTKEILMQP